MADPRIASDERRNWPVSRFRLGAEPAPSLAASTTAEERLAMMWPLARDAWAVAGLPLPAYTRRDTPVRRLPPVAVDAR